MKLFTFIQNGEDRWGVQTAKGALDLSAALQAIPADDMPQTVMQVIEEGASAITAIRNYVGKLESASAIDSYVLDESQLTWGPCVPEPGKIICIGLNYRKHAEETNSPIPEYPILFNKFNNTLTGHLRDIAIPRVTQKMDYEVELAVVIGKKAKNVSTDRALDHVFGYTVVNDLSARDLQLRTGQWLLGKSCDDFSPLGPYLVTADEVGDPNQLKISTTVNGEVRQNSNTSDMIFSVAEIVSYISQHMTLSPGDTILTGTPEGVVLGYPPEKQHYLQPGDVVSVKIEKLGELTNRFIADTE